MSTINEPRKADEAMGSDDERRDFDLWKHFAQMGAGDKHTMTTVVAWLLVFGVGAMAFVAKRETDQVGALPDVAALALTLMGVLVSCLAVLSTLLYAGYANWNWAQADEIARRRRWTKLLPEGAQFPIAPQAEAAANCPESARQKQ